MKKMRVTEFVNILKKELDAFHTHYTEQMAINDAAADLTEQEWALLLCEWDNEDK